MRATRFMLMRLNRLRSVFFILVIAIGPWAMQLSGSNVAAASKNQTASQPCTASQLSVKPIEGLSTYGTKDYLVSLKNVSSTSCALKGYPQLRMLDAGGKSIATVVTHRGDFTGAKATGVTLVTVKPGWSALFSLMYRDSLDYTPATCPISDHVEILVPNMKESIILKWRIQPFGGATVAKLHCGEIGASFLSGPYHLTKSYGSPSPN